MLYRPKSSLPSVYSPMHAILVSKFHSESPIIQII